MATEQGDADATASASPVIVGDARASGLATGESFVDEPDRYEVERQIGAGGMGVVVAARSERFGRPVAIKLSTIDRDDLRRRFEREARVTARLQHPAIVPVYSTGHVRGGRPFYAMKQVAGEPLDKVIAGAVTLEQRIALLPKVVAVTDAIAYAHAERVIHRDLKPANILVGAFGETIIIDWGLAKDLAARDDDPIDPAPYRTSADETAVGKVMGTPAYMPREQARGDRVDERADVYALGAILYHVLAGRPPFVRADEKGVPWDSMVARVLSTVPEPLATVQPGIAPDLVTIVERAMATSADARYPTAAELAEDLRRFTTGQLVGAHRYTIRQRIRRWLARHRAVATVGTIAALVLAGYGAWSINSLAAERTRAQAGEAAALDKTAEATERLSKLYEEQGRVEWLANRPDRALAYLAEAYRLGDRPSLRFLLASALPFLDAHRRFVIDPDTALSRVLLAGDAPVVATWSKDGAKLWDLATGKLVRSVAVPKYRHGELALSRDGAELVTLVTTSPTPEFDDPTPGTWDLAVNGRSLAQVSVIGRASVRVTSDGRGIIIAGYGEVELRDLATGASRATFHASVHALDAVAGRLFVWDRGVARIIDTTTAQPMSSWPHPAPVTRAWFVTADEVRLGDDGVMVAWTPRDGESATPEALLHIPAGAFACNDGWITVGDDHVLAYAGPGRPQQRFSGHVADASAIICSRHDQDSRMVSAAIDATKVWDPDTGELLASVEVEVAARLDYAAGAFVDGAVLPPLAVLAADHQTLVVAGKHGAEVWSVPIRRPFVDTETEPIPPGSRFGSAITTRNLHVYNEDIDVSDPFYAGRLNADNLHGATAFSPDGIRIATAAQGFRGSGVPQIVDARTGKRLYDLQQSNVFHLEWSADGRTIVAASREADGTRVRVNVWHPSTHQLVSTAIFPVERPLTQIHPEGNPAAVTEAAVAVWEEAESIGLWDPATGTRRATFPVWSFQLAADRAVLTDDGARWIADAATGRRVATLAAKPKPGMRVYANGPYGVSVSGDRDAQLFNTDTLAEIAPPEQERVVLSPDGKRVLVVDASSSHLFDADSGRELRTFARIRSGRFIGAGHQHVASNDGRRARLWDTDTGALVTTIDSPDSMIVRLLLDARNQRVITTHEDNTIRIWDVSTGNLLRTLRGHREPLLEAILSPDGERLAVREAVVTGAIRLWDLSASVPVPEVVRGRVDCAVKWKVVDDHLQLGTEHPCLQ